MQKTCPQGVVTGCRYTWKQRGHSKSDISIGGGGVSSAVEEGSSSLLVVGRTTCCFRSLAISLVRTGEAGGEAGEQEEEGRDEDISVDVFTLLLLELLFAARMSIGADEGEVERDGIAGVLLDRNIAGRIARTGMGGVEERICTGSLSSSNAEGSWSKSISIYLYLFL